MTVIFSRLRKREAEGETIGVAVVGTGLIGKGIVRQVELTPAMRTCLVVARRPEAGVEAYVRAGLPRSAIVVSDSQRELQRAIDAGKPAVTSDIDMIRDLQGFECAVEATGAVEYGAIMALRAIESGKHVIMMNAETDATVGCALKRLADEAGVVYTNSDGDQPGVLMRLVEWVRGTGFEIVAAVNCKGFLNVHATPDTIREWALKQGTSLPMTTVFTDGTKINIEAAVLCNATGLTPGVRGMHGVNTDMPTALADCMQVFGDRRGLTAYTLGGNFGGGVFVIGYAEDPVMVGPYLKYMKIGEGPNYLFFRPYHLCHLEVPLTIAEAALDHEATVAPLGAPVTEVVTIAKRNLKAGEALDGLGGYTIYGQVDTVAGARGLLPIGLSEGLRLRHDVPIDEPVPLSAVELDPDTTLMKLRAVQERMHAAAV